MLSIETNLNRQKISSKVTNDKFGLFLASEWERLIRPYVPYKTGQLQQNVDKDPFTLTYRQTYAHYMYEGVLYIDPVTGSPWAEFGTEKIPTTHNLTYRKDHNPFATDHWDEKAAQAGQLKKLYSAANKALNKNLF